MGFFIIVQQSRFPLFFFFFDPKDWNGVSWITVTKVCSLDLRVYCFKESHFHRFIHFIVRKCFCRYSWHSQIFSWEEGKSVSFILILPFGFWMCFQLVVSFARWFGVLQDSLRTPLQHPLVLWRKYIYIYDIDFNTLKVAKDNNIMNWSKNICLLWKWRLLFVHWDSPTLWNDYVALWNAYQRFNKNNLFSIVVT